jgi:hypothetical protein
MRDCSHAAVVEQPGAVSDALIYYADGLWPEKRNTEPGSKN